MVLERGSTDLSIYQISCLKVAEGLGKTNPQIQIRELLQAVLNLEIGKKIISNSYAAQQEEVVINLK